MNEAQIRKMIREVIRQELAQVMMAATVSNESSLRATARRFASEGPVGGLRKIQPFGVSSRAPAGTDCVVGPINGDASHLNILGEFDQNRPTGADGETLLYDAYGHVVYLSETKMQFGSKTSANPMVLGDILKAFEDAVWGAILGAPQIGFAAGGIPVFLDPSIRTAIVDALDADVDDADTNFLSQKAFTER